MPIYNVDKWLLEAFNSIVNQKGIDFAKEVEVILVNDCSPDKSKEICLNLCEKYENVRYIENKRNSGSSVSRNAGLQAARGEYINFFDPDDILSENTLFEVKKFINNNLEKIAHISIPLVYFEAEVGLHPKYKLLGNKNRIFDLKETPSNFILSAASSFYKRKDLNDLRIKFDESLFCEEDTKFNFELYREITPKFAYICENGVAYRYRRRKDANSQVDKGKTDKKAYYTLIQLISSLYTGGGLPEEIFYELCIYELRARLKNIKQSFFCDSEEFESVIDSYRKITNLIPKSFIFNKSKFLDISEKFLFATNIYKQKLCLKNDGSIYVEGSQEIVCEINDIPVEIKSISLEKTELRVEGLLNSYGIEDIQVVFFKEDSKEIIYPQEEYDTESIYVKSVDVIKSASSLKYFKLVIPLFYEGKYRIYFKNKETGYLHIANRIQTYSENPFLPVGEFSSEAFKKYTNFGTSVVLYRKAFIIEKSNLLSKIIDRIKTVSIIYEKHKKFKWLRFLKFGEPKYWLFNDRPINANDNAEVLFEHVNKHYPRIAKHSYYVLSKNSPEIERISKIGKVVIQNSLKHKFLYLNSKYILTSHLATAFFKPFSIKFLKYYNDLFDNKIIWLQHGITMNDIERAANKFNKQISKVIISAKFEQEIFAQKKYFFDQNDILVTGFSRYDNLKNNTANNILIMPSWRSYLSGKILSNGMHAPIKGFTESEYYRNFSNLLTNKRLITFLENSVYSIIFVLHPGLRQYSNYFKKFESKKIKILTKSSVSYRDLFNTSSLMVTDYSSVFFDFAYLEKPCIFFQFDKKDFFEKHYKEGLFKFETMAPGPICITDDEVVSQILNHAARKMKMNDKYRSRLDKIYLFNDKFNCHRIIKEII